MTALACEMLAYHWKTWFQINVIFYSNTIKNKTKKIYCVSEPISRAKPGRGLKTLIRELRDLANMVLKIDYVTVKLQSHLNASSKW